MEATHVFIKEGVNKVHPFTKIVFIFKKRKAAGLGVVGCLL